MITKETDAAIIELKRIVENELVLKTKFVYADIFEFNNDADLMQNAEFPCFLYFALDKSRYIVNQAGVLIRTIPIVGMMLDQYDSPTPDYKSESVNPVINAMRQLSENMVYHINKSQMSQIFQDTAGGVNNFSADSVYGKHDKHLFGVGVSFDWKMTEGKTGCHS